MSSKKFVKKLESLLERREIEYEALEQEVIKKIDELVPLEEELSEKEREEFEKAKRRILRLSEGQTEQHDKILEGTDSFIREIDGYHLKDLMRAQDMGEAYCGFAKSSAGKSLYCQFKALGQIRKLLHSRRKAEKEESLTDRISQQGSVKGEPLYELLKSTERRLSRYSPHDIILTDRIRGSHVEDPAYGVILEMRHELRRMTKKIELRQMKEEEYGELYLGFLKDERGLMKKLFEEARVRDDYRALKRGWQFESCEDAFERCFPKEE